MNTFFRAGIFFFLIFSTFTFSQSWTNLKKIDNSLTLNSVQKRKITKILMVEKKQAKHDRKLYRNNPVALIEAAKRRRTTTLMGIKGTLRQEQREKFKKFRRMSRPDRELFTLKEGLILSKEQTYHIDKIIRYYNNLINVKLEEMNEIRDEFRKYAEGNPGRRTRRGGQRLNKFVSSRFKELNKKKQKDIKTHLTKKQKKSYKKILKMQKEKQKEMIKKRRDRRSNY